MKLCRKCRTRLTGHTLPELGVELATLSGELERTGKQLRAELRSLAFLCTGLCGSCARAEVQPDWIRCTGCLRKVHAPVKNCPNPKCGRLLPRPLQPGKAA